MDRGLERHHPHAQPVHARSASMEGAQVKKRGEAAARAQAWFRPAVHSCVGQKDHPQRQHRRRRRRRSSSSGGRERWRRRRWSSACEGGVTPPTDADNNYPAISRQRLRSPAWWPWRQPLPRCQPLRQQHDTDKRTWMGGGATVAAVDVSPHPRVGADVEIERRMQLREGVEGDNDAAPPRTTAAPSPGVLSLGAAAAEAV